MSTFYLFHLPIAAWLPADHVDCKIAPIELLARLKSRKQGAVSTLCSFALLLFLCCPYTCKTVTVSHTFDCSSAVSPL